MNYIIVDLEATCWQGEKGKRNEIIEIGAVKLNDKLEIVEDFCEFIKPTLNPELSDFCKELTTITQEQVDTADPFPEVLDDFLDFIGGYYCLYCLCSWGHYDKNQFIKDCELHKIDTSWLDRHISVKHQYADFKGLRKKGVGMKRAMEMDGLQMEGTHHRGIDDARNITKIFVNNFENFNFPV